MSWSAADHDISPIDGLATTWTNFGETVQVVVPHFYTPVDLADLVAVVYQSSAAGKELHAVGGKHAFEGIAVAKDRLVSLEELKSPLTYVLDGALTDGRRAVQDDPAAPRKLFHVQAGIHLYELNEVLAAAGLAMISLGGANAQSLSGAVSTSTHGGDLHLPPLCDAVQAIHLVTAGGKQFWIERSSAPVTVDTRLLSAFEQWEPRAEGITVRRDDELFAAALVSCGRFGVMYSLVLEVAHEFRLAEYTVERKTTDVIGQLRDGVPGIAAGTGLAPVLDMLEAPPPDVGADTATGLHYFNITMASADPSVCWLQRRWLTSRSDSNDLTVGPNPFCGAHAAPAILGIAAMAIEVEALHVAAIPFAGLVLAPQLTARAVDLRLHAVEGRLTTGQAMAMALRAVWDSNLGWVVPVLNRTIVQSRVGDSSKRRRGPSHLVMTGDRESNRDCYTGRSTEIVFPADSARYLDFLETILPVGPTLQQAGYVSLRFCAPSAATMSMHHLPARLVVSIEVSSLGGLPDSASWVAFVERTAARFGGRPHWGQENKLTAAEVSALYQDDLATWRESLHDVSAMSSTFSNAVTRRWGLEPAPVPRAATISRVRIGDRVIEPDQFATLTVDLGDVDVGDNGSVDVRVRNSGSSRLHLGVSGPPEGDFTPADLRLEWSLEADTGSEAALFFLFTPTRPGVMHGTLTLSSDAPKTPELRFALTGTGHGPVLTIDRTSIDFGVVEPGAVAEETIVLRNDGDRSGRLIGTVVVDAKPADGFSVSPDHGEVAPGESLRLVVRFASTSGGPAGARLQLVVGGAGKTPRRNLEVVLGAVQLVAIPELTPAELFFPDVAVRRASSWQSVQLTNRGTGPLRIVDLLADRDFECLGPGTPVLEAGAMRTILVRFRPAVAGSLVGRVGLEDDASGSPHLVTCSGTAFATALVVADPPSVSFGAQPQGATGGPRSVRFTNDGTTPMHVASVDVSGTAAAEFLVSASPRRIYGNSWQHSRTGRQ